MTKLFTFAALIACSSFAFTACSNDEKDGDTAQKFNPGTIRLTSVQQQMSNNANQFAWNLMGAERSLSKGKNLVVSPLSMVYCLGMVNTGAVGVTSNEITSTLGFNGGVEDINQYCRTLLDEMPKLDS